MKRSWDQNRIQELIDDQIEESLTLEYKGKNALGKDSQKKEKITKAVSAIANSAGGTIIFGIREKGHLPEAIEPINRQAFSREWLEQVVGNIKPRIDNLPIYPVTLDTDLNDVVYVLEVPQSTTAHQATDFRYYKRHNFQAVPMEDYEIRDIMARIKHPKIEIELKIISSHAGLEGGDSWLSIIARNDGPVYAKYIKCILLLPENLLAEPAFPEDIRECDGNKCVEFSVSNGTRDVVDVDNMKEKYGPTWFNPLLPQTSRSLNKIHIVEHVKSFRDLEDFPIHWKVFADNAQPNSGKTSLDKVPEEFHP